MSQVIRHLILATAGHVDHGKSSLVRALTGVDPDRLPEEKARGMTIELGFAHLDLESVGTTWRLGIVDVPGHEDFIKNMVAGVGSIDLALLVVAADDGWMPQTEEHLQILGYLGVRRGVVALSKIDRAADEQAARWAVQERLGSTPFAEAPLVTTSIPTGRGLPELREALLSVARQTPPPRDISKPRLPIDRAFTLPGIGTVVTGTLIGGNLRQGQEALLQRGGKPVRIRRIQMHGRDAPEAVPGARVALNLSGVQAAHGNAGEGVRRGDVIATAGAASLTLDVQLWRLKPTAPDAAAPAPPPLRNGVRVHVHHGSSALPARAYLMDGGDLLPGQEHLAQLRLNEPLLAFGGDRLVVRDWSGRHTLAGGIVLDPFASRPNWRSDERRRLLERRAAAPERAAEWIETEVAARGVLSQRGLLEQSRFSTAEITAAFAEGSPASVVAVQGLLIDAGLWTDARRRVAEAVDEVHRAHPEHAGLPLAAVRPLLEPVEPELGDALLQAIIEALCSEGFARDGAVLRRESHRPALPPRLAPAGKRLREALAADPFNPPSRKLLVPDSLAEEALRFMLSSGEAVELSSDCVISGAALGRAAELVRGHIAEHGSATVSDLRDVLGSTRRTMVPLLERLDRDGVTRRAGDRRSLGPR